MTTSAPGVGYSDLIMLFSIGGPLIVGITVLLMRLLFKSYKQQLITTYAVKIDSLSKDIVNAVQDRKDCDDHHDKTIEKLELGIDKLRDQWLQFQKEAAQNEAVKGRRLDAMFNVLDHQKVVIQELRPAILERQKQLHEQSMNDMKYYVRQLVNHQMEKSHGKEKSNG